MYSALPRRGHHRKRLSALRLSSDSTVTTLPLYTSPPQRRHPDLPDIPSEQPPAYSDSAEEADEDTDASDTDSFIPSPPPSLPVSPRPGRRFRPSRGHRRQQSLASASDPYLDSLLARSVHALEMSNALLQSSMSTQSSLSAVLADDAIVDRSLEQRTQLLTSRIQSNRDLHESWMDDLDKISRGVEGLVRGENDDDDDNAENGASAEEPVSQSLPTGGLEERIQRRQGRRPSRSNLQLSAHERSSFVAPAPRALTMYIDSSEAADAIALPSTLGIRGESRPEPTPLPSQSSFSSSASEPEPPPSSSVPREERRAVEMLASFVMPRASSFLRRRGSGSSSSTVKKPRSSKSPPPSLHLDTPSASASSLRRGSPVIRQPRPLTPPIEELSTSSTSSDSTTLHVDRTVESLRQILEKQRAASQASDKAHSVPLPLPRPSLLLPPAVAPTSGTSTATASSRHTSSTRRSAPSTPLTPNTPVLPTPSPSLLSVPDVFGGMLGGRSRSGTSSGTSTPKRISFAEPPEPYSSSKPEGSSDKARGRSSSKGKGKDRGKGKGKAVGDGRDGNESDDEKTGWWTGWLLGAAAGGSGAGRARSEERFAYPAARTAGAGAAWSMRPGFGGSLEEWGA
ncbi:hypothetical protein C8Q78DRAFT_1065841 [Trametes maxima]|nr:hypothetical protein C8Q78DRAFT_1065841 [Trametes maxima]